jgi:outer membrane protein assembly factor BamB
MPRVRRFGRSTFIASMLLVPGPWSVDAGEWSRFRGPNGAGISPSTGLPVEFGPGQNVAWEASVPFGRSSPIVAGGRIFVTAVESDRLWTIALDLRSGKTLWRRGIERGQVADLHQATDSATPTPAADEAGVYAFFHEAGLVAYDHAGKERWRIPLGPFRNFYGIAASPVVSGGRLFLNCDQAKGSYLLAVDTKNGEELWRRNRSARVESYSTPMLIPNDAAPAAVVVSGSRWVDAYEPATGKELWTVAGVGTGPIASPVAGDGLLFVNAPDHAEQGWSAWSEVAAEHDADKDGALSKAEVADAWMAKHFGWLDADQNGSLSADDWKRATGEIMSDAWGVFAIRLPEGDGQPVIAWNYRKNVPSIPSPLFYGERFYMVDDGIVTSLDPRSGDLLKRDRLGNGSSKVYASPVAADGRIYIADMDGRVTVLADGPEWKVLATNDLNEEIWATPAIVDGRLYVRTKSKVYAFALGAAEQKREG